MERGIYFDGWYKHNFCYHPSLPLRCRQMLEDIEQYHATALAWAGLGGGSISLPFLEHEAFGDVDPRMQIYGYMNDSEFIAECSSRGIRLFGIVFEVQGWEYPVITDEKGRIIRMNLRAEDSQNHSWYGLREFSQDKFPDAFHTRLKDYYPDGIRDEDENIISDLWEECCIRDRFGNPVHAKWVEITGHRETCYQMCRNNPVWRNYLKKIMEIQIDAGVPGIQLDECELPMTSISSGGCFCKSCMKQFTAFLKERKEANRLSAEWDGIELNSFNYGEYLVAHGSTFPEGAPFFKEYWEFQVLQVRKYFGELADHARNYAISKYGRRLEISGNFYNMQPAYYPIENKVDIIITEMDHTLFRQPYYYRYCTGFAAGKPVIIAENPYGGIIPRMLEMLDRGRGYDLFRIFLLEASVYGCNMSVPYGGWMGNSIKDSFWAPRAVTSEIQDFLASHEDFYPQAKSTGAAVLYSYGSYYWRDSNKGSGANGMQDSYSNPLDAVASEWLDPDQKPVPFWDIIRAISDINGQYDVIMLPDGEFRQDDFSDDSLEGYPLVIVPDCWVLTKNQQDILLRYASSGGRILAAGRIAEGTDLADDLKRTGNAVFIPLDGGKDQYVPRFMAAFEELYSEISPVECRADNIGIQRYDSKGKTFVHILNYNYDDIQDRIVPVTELRLILRNVPESKPEVIVPDGSQLPECEMIITGETQEVILRKAGLYTVLVFG